MQESVQEAAGTGEQEARRRDVRDKAEAMAARFEAKGAEFETVLEQRRRARAERTVAAESGQVFWNEFQACKAECNELCKSASDLPDRAALQARFEMLTRKTGELQAMLSKGIIFLPPYDVRQAQLMLKETETMISGARDKLLPRQRFRFSRRERLVRTKPADADAAAAAAAAAAAEKAKAAAAQAEQLDPDASFADVTGQVLVKHRDQLAGQDFTLARLTDCTVFLLGSVTALRMSKLSKCCVVVWAVSGSAHMEQCSDCEFWLALHQFRLHDTRRSDFYLFAGSKPIIEHSDHLRFAPNLLVEKDVHARSALAFAKLHRLRNFWSNIEDFNWLREQQSPNWCILPAAERKDAPALPPGALASGAAGPGAAGAAVLPASLGPSARDLGIDLSAAAVSVPETAGSPSTAVDPDSDCDEM